MPSKSPIRISLFAPSGRMGQAIAAAIAEDRRFVVVEGGGDVLVDFSAPGAAAASLDRALVSGTPLLIGTTGLDEDAELAIAKAAERIAVLRAANTALGVALLAE